MLYFLDVMAGANVRELKEARSILVAIVGPTAVGKTAVGIELARSMNGEIISADSMAVYKGMEIGTAKPTPQERERARFHLIDIVYPNEAFNVAEFKRLCDEAIADIVSRGKMPLLVGGTGLYVRAVTGEYNIPAVPPNVELREKLRVEATELGNQALLERLRVVDPVTADRLHCNDVNRIIRALEVHNATGMPLSHYHQNLGSIDVNYDVRLFGLTMSREVLYERIERRIDQWMDEGLVEEVRALLNQGYDRSLASMKGLGYKQIAGYILGEYNLETAIDLLKRDTRRFAKRQFTWFKAVQGIHWIDAQGRSASEVADQIIDVLNFDLRAQT